MGHQQGATPSSDMLDPKTHFSRPEFPVLRNNLCMVENRDVKIVLYIGKKIEITLKQCHILIYQNNYGLQPLKS